MPLLGIALLIALGFAFVNAFHDEAAIVICTRSTPLAVVWSGVFDVLGARLSGGIATGIITLLPVELILQVGSGAGKQHLTDARGAPAALTILGTGFLHRPASTTPILSSGVAGTLAAKGLGSTVRSIASARVLTPSCAMLIAGRLFALLRALF